MEELQRRSILSISLYLVGQDTIPSGCADDKRNKMSQLRQSPTDIKPHISVPIPIKRHQLWRPFHFNLILTELVDDGFSPTAEGSVIMLGVPIVIDVKIPLSLCVLETDCHDTGIMSRDMYG